MSEHPQTDRPDRNGEVNKLHPMDRPVHDWYRFVLSFPPHLVRSYVQRFEVNSGQRVLDPFCGTGTTLVESQKIGISSIGIEANPMAYFASQVKVNWSPNPDHLVQHAENVAKEASEVLESQGIEDNPVFLRDMADLRALKRSLVRSNTRGVYKNDDDDRWISGHAEVQRIAEAIEARRMELGKTSGFERQYARVTKLYFGGMAKHLADLRKILRPGAQLAYVVGDQASYLRVMIRTGELLADISRSLGYEVTSIDLFRTRLSTATRDQLREEVVVLRWPGRNASPVKHIPNRLVPPEGLSPEDLESYRERPL